MSDSQLEKRLAVHGFTLTGPHAPDPGEDFSHALITSESLKWFVPYRKTRILGEISARAEFSSIRFDHEHAPVPGFTVMNARMDLNDPDSVMLLARFLKSGAVGRFHLAEAGAYVYPKILFAYLSAPEESRAPIENRIRTEVDRQAVANHDAILLNTKGLILAGLGDAPGAARSFLHAAELNPNFAEPFSNMGSLLWDRGSREEAFLMFRQAFLRLPMDPVIRENFMEAGMHLGCFAKMQECLDEARKNYPEYAGFENLISQVSHQVSRQAI